MDTDQWLVEHGAGASPEEALALFDSLDAVPADDMLGRWRGSGLPTGSPLDGLLEAYGWYGKEFLDAETVHPLLFTTSAGPRPVDPAFVPMAVLRDRPALAHSRVARAAFRLARPLVTTSKPCARLRTVEHRGVSTAAMVYDALPIIDHFRRLDEVTLLGLMDARGLEPYFFQLHRQ